MSEHVQAAQMTQRRRDARQSIHFYARDYRETSNPLAAWDAICECVDAQLPFPSWVREYLHEVGAAMSRLSREGAPREGEIHRAVALALGIGARGRSNPFRDRFRVNHEVSIAFEVYLHQSAHRHYDWQAVFKDVAHTHPATCHSCNGKKISWQKVRACWYTHALTVIPGHIVGACDSSDPATIIRAADERLVQSQKPPQET